MLGPKPPNDFDGNGCTGVPDGWWYEACRYHDWAYRPDVPISRWLADWYFFRNLISRHCPMSLAILYWFGVRCFGRRFFRK